MTVDEVMDEVRKDVAFYETSGGGVTFSGGEPAVHARCVQAVLSQCRREGIGTAVETCGHVPWENLESLVPFTDLFLYDVKHMDSRIHEVWTGVPNERILSNLRQLVAVRAEIVVRTPVVPGFNADPASVGEIAQHVAWLKRVLRLELLPYHNYGLAKYSRLGREYRLSDTRPPDAELMEELAGAARAFGVEVQVGG